MSGRAEPFFSATTARRRTASLPSCATSSCRSGPHVVDVAGVVAREPLEREQRRAAHRGAVVLEPAPQELLLRAEPELADRAVGDRALAKVRSARRRLELVVPLRAQLRQLTLLPLLGERVASPAASASDVRIALPPPGEPAARSRATPSAYVADPRACAAAGRCSAPTAGPGVRVRFCSRMCADQPATRAQPNIAGVRSGGISRVVEHDRRPVLDVRLELAVGRPLAQHLERGLLERRRHLDARRAELHRRALEHGRARVVRRDRRGGRSP